MAEPGKKLGKLSLAILENFVEGVLGEKFVDELRQPTDREIAITTALGETEDLFVVKYEDKALSKALFIDLKQADRPVLKSAVGKYFDHPTEPSLRQSLQQILFDEFSSHLLKEQIDRALDFYLKLLTKELMLADDVFRNNIAALAIVESNLLEQRQVELLEKIAEKIVNQQATSQQVLRSLHQLPQPPADFTGREELIDQLLEDFNSHKGAPISGLTGMGGIGKTALGLKVAHKIAENYPDAQIFLDLKGTTTPLSALDIARHVILSFEPTADLRAMDEANMQGVYQSILHGKKVLLFFDNARSAEQIAPLTPPNTCAMIVTSRWTFGVPGLQSRRVAMMSDGDAKDFLLELCPRIGDKAAELARACTYLPLALRIAGSFLQVNSGWLVEKYLNQLSNRKQRLETFKQSREGGELTTEPDLLATFELSYDQLSEENQERWRMLGVFPTSFASTAVQAMWNLDENETIKTFGLFRRYSLLDFDEASKRYDLHDLLKDYALLQTNDVEADTIRITHAIHYSRVFDEIAKLYVTGEENLLLALHYYDIEQINIEVGQQTATAYLEKNLDAAEACNRFAQCGSINSLRLKPKERVQWLESGLQASRVLNNKDSEIIHLGNLGSTYADMHNGNKALEIYNQVLLISKEIKNDYSEAKALIGLGTAYSLLYDTHKSVELYEEALSLVRRIGNIHEEGVVLACLGVAYSNLNELNKAIECLEKSLAIMQKFGDLRGVGIALGNLDRVHADLHDTVTAIKFYEQALVSVHNISDFSTKSTILGNLGSAYVVLEEFSKAIEYYNQQLMLEQEYGNKKGEGDAHWGIALCLNKMGEIEEARKWFLGALEIFKNIESPEAIKIQKIIDELDGIEEFVRTIVSAVREKRPEADKLFETVSKMVADPEVLPRHQELGNVLKRYMSGVKNLDLSKLPKEIAEIVRKAIEAG